MTNPSALEEKIRSCGMKKSYIAKRLGISPSCFWLKMRGDREFKASEMQTMCDLLGIKTMDEMAKIFFA